ncbi:DUF2927 domain-containing protein [Vibrio tapetis subsp. quintayensis]|uniref:DUF2927 domain-containing protein n=1 Tax=Vibrio tapetis TaxID=52443 RepID=UPI0025B31399|nr:DUF2927 domain-containing protein [Vibrio tapetis]MDN3682480.1 DUF2927 domain-containing protein [Vibrio tapetis subsp. quintayensis]
MISKLKNLSITTRTLKKSAWALCLGLSSHWANAAEPRWKDPEIVEQVFYLVALHNEYSQGQQKIRKWAQPIHIYLDHQVPDEELHTDLARMQIEHLTKLTNHPINFVDTAEQANVIWQYTRQSKWEESVRSMMGEKSVQHVKSALCMANFATNSRDELVRANIIIPVDQARDHGKLLACVVEEVTQIMGLPNDSDQAYPSIFNDHSPEDLLSPLDGLLLKLLYDPSVKAGMTQEEVTPIIQELLLQFVFDGTFDRVISDVNQGELHQMMGYGYH